MPGRGEVAVTLFIRPYRTDDLESVAIVWLEGFQSSGVHVGGSVDLNDLRTRLPLEISKGWAVHVAEVGNEIIGFAAFIDQRLCQLFVTPPAQGRGVGKVLLVFVKQALPDGFWLTTALDNHGARRFYEREGLAAGAETTHPALGHKIIRYDWHLRA